MSTCRATLVGDSLDPGREFLLKMFLTAALVVACSLTAAPAQARAADPPVRAAATCADYDNQRDAQNAADTRDADGDGIYCEALPCPCSNGSGGGGGGGGNSGGDRPRKPKKKRPMVVRGVITDVVDG